MGDVHFVTNILLHLLSCPDFARWSSRPPGNRTKWLKTDLSTAFSAEFDLLDTIVKIGHQTLPEVKVIHWDDDRALQDRFYEPECVEAM